jgi:hypothetical protein
VQRIGKSDTAHHLLSFSGMLSEGGLGAQPTHTGGSAQLAPGVGLGPTVGLGLLLGVAEEPGTADAAGSGGKPS